MYNLSAENKRQAGASKILLLIIIAMTAFCMMVLVKLGPLYYDDALLVNVLESLAKEETLSRKSQAEVRNIIAKRLRVNNVYGFDLSNIKIKKEKRKIKVSANYDKTVPLLMNISLFVQFEHDLEF